MRFQDVDPGLTPREQQRDSAAGAAEGEAARRVRGPSGRPQAPQAPARRRAAPGGRVADSREPRLLRCAAGPVGCHRRAELRDPQVPGADLPAADLPGRRDRVRRALGDPGGDQRDRDRLRAQPERLERGRPRLDAVHPQLVARLRGGRQQGRRQGPLQPGRRDLRRRPLPRRGRLRGGRAPRDLRLQPRRLVRRLGDAARAADRRRARGRDQLPDGPDRGPLPGGGPCPLRRRPRRARGAAPRQARPRTPPT